MQGFSLNCCNGHVKTLPSKQVYHLSYQKYKFYLQKAIQLTFSQVVFNKTRAKAFLATRKTPMGSRAIVKTLQIHSLLPFSLFKNSEKSYTFCTDPCFLVPANLNV